MKKIRYFFEYIIVSLLFILFKFIGYQNSSNIGAKIGAKFSKTPIIDNFFASSFPLNKSAKQALPHTVAILPATA